MHILKSLMTQFLLGALLLVALIGLISYSQILADQNMPLVEQYFADFGDTMVYHARYQGQGFYRYDLLRCGTFPFSIFEISL